MKWGCSVMWLGEGWWWWWRGCRCWRGERGKCWRRCDMRRMEVCTEGRSESKEGQKQLSWKELKTWLGRVGAGAELGSCGGREMTSTWVNHISSGSGELAWSTLQVQAQVEETSVLFCRLAARQTQAHTAAGCLRYRELSHPDPSVNYWNLRIFLSDYRERTTGVKKKEYKYK